MPSLKDIKSFETDILEGVIREFAESTGIKAGVVIHPLRLALTGQTTSPGIFDVMYVLGKETVVRRVDKAINFIEKKL